MAISAQAARSKMLEEKAATVSDRASIIDSVAFCTTSRIAVIA